MTENLPVLSPTMRERIACPDRQGRYEPVTALARTGEMPRSCVLPAKVSRRVWSRPLRLHGLMHAAIGRYLEGEQVRSSHEVAPSVTSLV
jgi:hypothetical protein